MEEVKGDVALREDANEEGRTRTEEACREETGRFDLPGEVDDVHIVPVSGGADSTSLAVLLGEMYPEVPFRYVFTDTGAEPPELYEVLDRLETHLGRPIERLAGEHNLWELIEKYGGYLPNAQSRWCTRALKGSVLQQWLKRFAGKQLFMYVGIRADERFRMGFSMDGVTTVMPYMNLGWKRADVFRKLAETVGIPSFYKYRSRSGCSCCPFARRQEYIGVLQWTPIEFKKGEAYEKLNEADAKRHPDAPSLCDETGIALNWMAMPLPSEQERIEGRMGARGTTLFGDRGVFIGAEFMTDCAPGGSPFIWAQRIVSFSRSLSGIKKQLNSRYLHLLHTAEAQDMTEWEVKNSVVFAIYYIEAPAEVFDPEGTTEGSFTWHAEESLRMLRHITGWAARVLHAAQMTSEVARMASVPATSFAWEVGHESARGLERVSMPTGRLVAMERYKAREPDLEDELDERYVSCAACSI